MHGHNSSNSCDCKYLYKIIKSTRMCYVLFYGIGGLKLWEGSLDLVKALRSEDEAKHLSIAGKRVLEVGCDC